MPTFAQLAQGVRYGYTFDWHVKIEGIPVISCERIYDNAPPAGYTLDGSLIIEPSAVVGSIVDRTEKTGIGKGFPLTFRFSDTAAVRGLFGSPSVMTTLRSDLAPNTTANMAVTSTTGFAAAGNAYLETETIPYASKDADDFLTLTRGTYGTAYRHRAGDAGGVVTDKPEIWRGRRVWLYAVLVDPYGKTIYASNVLDNAALVWTGFVEDEPDRNTAGEWTFQARSIDRVLADPLASAITGNGVLTLDDDWIVPFTQWDRVRITIEQVSNYGASLGITVWEDKDYYPFMGMADLFTGTVLTGVTDRGFAWASAIRKAVESTFNAASHTNPGFGAAIGTFSWEKVLVTDSAQTAGHYRWNAKIAITGDNLGVRQFIKVRVELTPPYYPNGLNALKREWQSEDYLPGGSAFVTEVGNYSTTVATPLYSAGGSNLPCVRLELTDGDPADIPDTGFVRISFDNQKALYEYRKLTRYGDVFLMFGADAGPAHSTVIAGLTEGSTDHSVELAFVDSGNVRDMMRRMLVSTGEGTNGAYDTLEASAGYGIAEVDTASFDTVLDGFYSDLSGDVITAQDTSFAKTFGGILTLSQRAIVAKGANLQLTAVHTGHPDAKGGSVVTLTDRDLAYSGKGKEPLRKRDKRKMPTSVSVNTTRAGEETGRATANDVYRARRAGPEQWTLDFPGLDKASMTPAIQTWAKILYRSARTEQAIEIDVPPWYAIDIGDVIACAIKNTALWQASSQTPGYTGLGRVIGRQFNLTTYIVTLIVLVDGSLLFKPLCPAAPVIDYAGTTGAPTTVWVPIAWADAFEGWDTGTWKMLAYERSVDADGNYLQSTSAISRAIPTAAAMIVSAVTGTVDVGFYAATPAPITISTDDFEDQGGAATPEGKLPNGKWRDLGTGTNTRPWQTRRDATPSAGTGPQGTQPNVDHTVSPGAYYAYCETSNGSTGSTYHLGATFDLSAYANKVIFCDFWKYLYGATIGTLKLQVFSAGAWVDLYSITGDQGMGWTNTAINISRFASSATQLRFQYARGSSFTGDAALDDITIKVYEPKCYLTIPNSANDNAEQGNYLHNDDPTVWG